MLRNHLTTHAWILLTVASLAAGVTPASSQPAPSLHALGYSLTFNAICGTQGLFFREPFERECQLYREYGGGTLEVWWSEIGSPQHSRWRFFQRGIEENGIPEAVYWQIGLLAQTSPDLTPAELQWALDIADHIRARAPGATIYVSGMSRYVPPLCERTNANAAAKSWAAAGILWGTASDIEMGPVMPTITPAQTTGSGDPCHLGPSGIERHGAELLGFFEEKLGSP